MLSLNKECRCSSIRPLLGSSDAFMSLNTSRNGLVVGSLSGGNPASIHGRDWPSRSVKELDCCSEPSARRSRREMRRRAAARRSIRVRRILERGGDVALHLSAVLEATSDSTGAINNLQQWVNKCTFWRNEAFYCDDYAKDEADDIK